MIARAARVLPLVAAIGVVAVGCGKRGDPKPPLRPVPARIGDFSAARVGDRIELRFTVPATNADGSTPPAIDHVDIYREATVAPPAASAPPALSAASAPPAASAPSAPSAAAPAGPPAVGAPPPGMPAGPAAAHILADTKNLRTRMAVRPLPADGAPAPTVSDARPAPGDHATFSETVDPAAATRGETWYFVAVGVAGGGRGRQSTPSAVLAVPLGAVPAPPANVSVDFDATTITVRWERGDTKDTFRVLEAAASGAAATSVVTAEPLAASTYTTPVVFGRERCFAVRTVHATGPVTVEGATSPTRCVTPVDRFPPPAPAGLQAVQEGAAVTLLWSAVTADDLAGYLVLRSDGGEDFMPVFREPAAATSYRDESVRAGSTYGYVVIALDKAGNPSAQSNRQTVTVR